MYFLIVCISILSAADYQAPAGTRFAIRRPGAESILPGGRIIAPIGKQFTTGPGPFGLAISPSGKTIISSDGGPRRYTLTVLQSLDRGRWQTQLIEPSKVDRDDDDDDDEWRSVFMGIAFEDEKTVFASEGNSGRVRSLDVKTGRKRSLFKLNQNGFKDSFTGDLAFDAKRNLLYVVDQANFRLVVIDTKRKRVTSSIKVGRMPFAVALSPDGARAYVTNSGMFEYTPLPGADPKQPRTTGIAFPPFGFPSPEARDGVERQTIAGATIKVPGLGDPNHPESNSLTVLNVEDPNAPKLLGHVPTGLPFGDRNVGGSSPSGVVATKDRIFVSNSHNDSITVIDAATRRVLTEVRIRIPGLENLRGVMPIGMAFDEASGWLFVSEAGINAVGIIDTRENKVLGHVPTAWFPSRIVIDRGVVYVACAKGHGTGPNATRAGAATRSFQADIRRGVLQFFPIPDAAELARFTQKVYANNGFLPVAAPPAPLPPDVKHIVIIIKENRTYDEVFGDIPKTNGIWELARFGVAGVVSSTSTGLKKRISLKSGTSVTPNHHALAASYSISDNFYADSEVSVDGHHWLVGSYPDPWLMTTVMSGGQKDFRMPTDAPGRLRFIGSRSSVHPDEQPENGTLWHHLDRHGIRFRNYGEGFELASVDTGPGLKPTGASLLINVPMPEPLFRNTSREYAHYNTNIPDQYRATQFISEIEKLYVKGTEPFPQLVFIHLPNDHMAKPRPEDGYPIEASFVADNDYALGRIVDYLSHSPWWKNMAIFVTEDDAQGGVDHIDSHRTIFLHIGPYAKKNYVSHVNTSFPGMLKTTFRLLGMPALNLFDAAATDLSDTFTSKPDYTPYSVVPVPKELFDPSNARDPLDPKPGPKMDDPAFLRQQHR